MLKYLCKKVGQSIFTLFFVITAVFLLMRLMPEEGYFSGNYDKLDTEQKEIILTNMGLRDPLPVQLGKFYVKLAKGDLGESIKYRPKVPVGEIIKTKLPYSIAFGVGIRSKRQ